MAVPGPESMPTRSHRSRRSIVLALLAVVAMVVGGAGSQARPAEAAEACPSGGGVTVVVDFGSQGGGIQVRCVTGSVSSGLDALRRAGFTVTSAQRFPGLVCRIDGRPADDPCVNAPPADRVWRYWTAPRPGATWTYSDVGAGNRVPPAGSVEGWAFSEGCLRRPGSGPCPTATTQPPSPATTRPPGAEPDGGGGAPAPTADRSSGVGGGAEPPAPGSPHATLDPATSTSTTAAADEADVVDDADDPTVEPGERAPGPGDQGDDEELAAEARDTSGSGGGGGGSAVGALVGTGAVMVVAGAAVVTARRRRGTELAEV